MLSMDSIHCLISGRVQGVGFRYATQQRARVLKLRGWVRNLSDGRVELIAAGAPDKLMKFKHWLDTGGPPAAKVAQVKSVAWSGVVPTGFQITR